ncbi:704e7ef9-8d7b-4daf-a1a4-b2e579fc53c9 [Sclerotinia trifoliorum]|uniref:tyrosine--tRNA ligase n=1 Tax=Sclerotinia trifoliorum TaxID=28548 RepID=A0A8H2ZT53_9HELO|nr:704e7ef9-8d7b-4daf-a1a4-b2e579fc53c9 [Sclerotinia trifoliorum]
MAPSDNNVAARLDLITERIPEQSIQGLDLIEASLKAEGRNPRCLWATSPTGKPHIGYFIPVLKFADFIEAGVDVVITLLDVYSFLDNVHYPMEQVLQRMHYYKFVIIAAAEAIGIPASKLQFVQESTYVNTPEFTRDQWRLCTIVPQQAVKDAWDRSYNPDMLSPMFCPGMQSLAEEYLDIDFQFGGADQAGIFGFSDRFLPQLGFKRRGHLMNPMLPNLQGGKMSSSHPPSTKIALLDDAETVTKKLFGANTKVEGASTNGVMASLRDILIPISNLRARIGITEGQKSFAGANSPDGTVFSVKVKSGEEHFSSYEEVEKSLIDGRVTVEEINTAIAGAFNQLLDTIRKKYEEDEEWQAATKLAYPVDA